MENVYKHQLLHEQQLRDRLKQAENERLVQLITSPTTHIQPVVELSGLISKWWMNRWSLPARNQSTKHKIVMPKA